MDLTQCGSLFLRAQSMSSAAFLVILQYLKQLLFVFVCLFVYNFYFQEGQSDTNYSTTAGLEFGTLLNSSILHCSLTCRSLQILFPLPTSLLYLPHLSSTVLTFLSDQLISLLQVFRSQFLSEAFLQLLSYVNSGCCKFQEYDFTFLIIILFIFAFLKHILQTC